MLAWGHHPLYQVSKGQWTTAAELRPRHSRYFNHVSNADMYSLLLETLLSF